MSRPVLEITLQLPNGQILKGFGRNLTVTIARIYSKALGSEPHRHVTLMEHLKTGHVGKGEHRYQGTFHARFATRGGGPASQEAIVVAEVQERKSP